ncbi:hypothetical protein [Moritella sp. Urea-trap-13]|uniref:hypothetical protein n=1 Tax=Moritella sp. Urea-trap-13 TaxID=2058327 RepID=UPI000C32602B|nr:hypothetical protein [Moritella sp. Urea-trap-13]PKH05327.1 hypothetical protein CXF93_18750 [Moritella sp. Urea-trap-13]
MSFLSNIKSDFQVNKNFISRLAILIIRTERLPYISWLITPFRVILLNLMMNCEIPKTVKIGRYFRLPHPFGIIIHSTAEIGNYVTIYQHVTIGSNEFISLGCSRKASSIGDFTLIGANSCLIGKIDIGSNVIIAATELVSIDITSNSFYKNGIYKNNIDLANYNYNRKSILNK